MDTFNSLAENAHQVFEARSRARDQALNQTRQLTRLAAHTIRAIHRDEREQADNLLNEAKTIVETLKNDLKQYPDLYYAGYTQDAIKEYAESGSGSRNDHWTATANAGRTWAGIQHLSQWAFRSNW